MAEKHPYNPGGAGGIIAAILQLRKSFPAKVTSETLKKLGIASNSESYVINVLRFVGLLDADGNRTQKAAEVFSKHNDSDFEQAFGEMVKTAYSELFGLHADEAWDLSSADLISFFRTTDQTSAITGQRQAVAFQALASLAGHGEITAPKPKQNKETKKSQKAANVLVAKAEVGKSVPSSGNGVPRDVGLTVRVEVNLPPAADQETYDRIFRSIRENLLNAK